MMCIVKSIICAIVVLNQILLVETGGSCKDEVSTNTVEVLFNKDGNILLLDEWNDEGSNDKFKSVMADQATTYCANESAECSLINYDEATHPFTVDNVVISSTPIYANGYIKIVFYIKLTGIEMVYGGSQTIHVLRKSTLQSITEASVTDLNGTLGFTTAFIDGKLMTEAIDNSLDKIIIPIAVVVVLILSIVVYGLIKTHDEVEELKRISGYGSRTRVSPGIPLPVRNTQVRTQHEGMDQNISPNCSNSEMNSSDLNPQLKYNDTGYGHNGHVPRIGLPHGPTPYAYPRRSFKVKDIETPPSKNEQLKYNDTEYGHNQHVPRIGLPHGPTPYAYPRRSFKVKDLKTPPSKNEETPPPGYKESQQKACMPPQETAAQPVEEAPEPFTAFVKPPEVTRRLPPEATRRLPPLVPISRPNPAFQEESSPNKEIDNQPIKDTQTILGKECDTDPHAVTELKQKRDEVTPNGAPMEEGTQPVVKDTLPTNGVSGLQENPINSVDNETKKAGKKKHKKHKHKHKHRHNSGEENEEDGHKHRHNSGEENDGQDRTDEEEGQRKRKKHRKKKKKKHRHKHSDDDEEEADKQ